MRKLFLLGLCTMVFTALGLYVGHLLHGMTVRTLIATCAGAAGGLGIGCAGTHVLRLWRSGHKRGQASLRNSA